VGVTAGPLSADRLWALLHVESKRLTAMLGSTLASRDPDPIRLRLNALWQILVPPQAREELLSGACERLIIIPHGPLALVPFDVLVVEAGSDPRYLLDVAPPISYAHSATLLHNLEQRPVIPGPADLKPVLTIGDASFAAADNAPSSDTATSTSRARYSRSGGKLSPLPFSGLESTWVADVFARHGFLTGKLLKHQATEALVRYNVPGRRVVHVACHGIMDESHGNLFGALALTPGTSADRDVADDGFLTLPEIYDLDLRGCELAILSACETNAGPQEAGEGVWALSRGCIVAGARRVVASNWLVDDEAAASLISYFCAGVAEGEQKGGKADHAAALHAAKRWVRSQEKWSSPYFWGSFVLVGPK
jgi:CHAT domain-containing protein